MKVLHIIAQKPYSTGSGVYMDNLIKAFYKNDIENIAIYGIDEEDENYFDENIAKNLPVRFNNNKLKFHLFGMSDEMPYKITRYRDMTKEKEELFKNAFKEKILYALENYDIDLIICHHLYLLTALTREIVKDKKIYGICHNTDLRQYVKTDSERDYIKSNIRKLDHIFCVNNYLKTLVKDTFDVDVNKISEVGIGYNDKMFQNKHLKKNENIFKFVYVGKVSKKKGVLSLIKAFNNLKNYDNKIDLKNVYLQIVGGISDEEEFFEIKKESDKNENIKLLGRISNEELIKVYDTSNAFVIVSLAEGVPLVSIEALSSGLRVITSDIPGVKDFLTAHVENAYIDYVELPKLTNFDCATDEELEKFEKRIEIALNKILLDRKNEYNPILKNLSWDSVRDTILSI